MIYEAITYLFIAFDVIAIICTALAHYNDVQEG